MSTLWKVIVGLVIITGLVFGWKYMKNKEVEYSPSTEQTPTMPTTVVPGGNSSTNNNSTLKVSSDSSLDADLSSLDTQMNSVNNSETSVDQSFNDTQIPQSE